METIARKTRTRLSPERRKQQLLDFALHVFARRGIGRAGHADIADMANVSVATVFNYFPTREALVEEVLTQVAQHFHQLLLESCTDEDLTLSDRLNSIMDNIIDHVIAQQEWIKVWFEWSPSVRDEIWPQFIQNNKASVDLVADVFEEGRENDGLKSSFNIKELTRLFHGLCYVVYLQTQQHPDQDQMQKQARLYLEHTLNIS